jgi:hypothetical protein
MLAEKNINKYDSISAMQFEVAPYLDTQIISKSEHTKAIKNSEAEKLYENVQFLVVHPKTKWAASAYGRHTKWCTATDRYFIDYFTDYAKKANCI